MPGPVKKFEDLDAWMNARQLVNGIYRLTLNGPVGRDFGLSSQIQRAAVSVMSNIAEGFERAHPREKMQAYNIARGSVAEVRSLLYVIEDNYSDLASAVAPLRSATITIGRLVTGLLRSTDRR